jgi:hypothetical protein
VLLGCVCLAVPVLTCLLPGRGCALCLSGVQVSHNHFGQLQRHGPALASQGGAGLRVGRSARGIGRLAVAGGISAADGAASAVDAARTRRSRPARAGGSGGGGACYTAASVAHGTCPLRLHSWLPAESRHQNPNRLLPGNPLRRQTRRPSWTIRMLRARQRMHPWAPGVGSYGCVRRSRRCFEVTSSCAHVVLCAMLLSSMADALLTPSLSPMRLTPLSVLSPSPFQAARFATAVRRENFSACKRRVHS